MFSLTRSEIINNLQTFLFLHYAQQLSDSCLGIISLRKINQILSIFGLFGSIYGIFLGITSQKIVLTVVYCAVDIISFICCLLILISTWNRNFRYAYWGYIISSNKMILYFVVYLLYLFLFRFLSNVETFEDPTYQNDLFGRFLETVFKIPVTIYFLWISFCYTRHLALGNYDIIDGKI